MSSTGVKIYQFDIPVCNKFRATVLNDLLCYEVDPNDFKDSLHLDRDRKIGLTLLLDYNEDRQVIFERQTKSGKDDTIYGQFIQSENEEKVLIHMNTIGNFLQSC